MAVKLTGKTLKAINSNILLYHNNVPLNQGEKPLRGIEGIPAPNNILLRERYSSMFEYIFVTYLQKVSKKKSIVIKKKALQMIKCHFWSTVTFFEDIVASTSSPGRLNSKHSTLKF